MMRRLLSALVHDEQGQDLTEYTLLIAMVATVAFGLFASTGQSAAGIWYGAGTHLSSASGAASGSLSGGTGPTGSGGHQDHH